MKKLSILISTLFIVMPSMAAEPPALKLISPASSGVAPAVSASEASQPLSISAPSKVAAPSAPSVPVKIEKAAPAVAQAQAKAVPVATMSAPSVTSSTPVIMQSQTESIAPSVTSQQATSGSSTSLGSSPIVPASAMAVNPFSGEAASSDILRMQLNTSRVRTQLLEEQLKQATLAEEFGTIKAKKSVEQAQALTAFMREEATQKELGGSAKAFNSSKSMGADSTSSKPSSKKVTSKKTSKKIEVEAPKKEEIVAVKQPSIGVTSIINVKGRKSAILEIDGNTLPVADNEQTAYGLVQITSESSLKIGGRSVSVHPSTIGRFTVSDNNKPEDKNKQAGSASAMVASSPAASKPNTASAQPSSLPPGIVLPPPLVSR